MEVSYKSVSYYLNKINVGYNYPTPLAIKVPKEITEQWKMDDIGEI